MSKKFCSEKGEMGGEAYCGVSKGEIAQVAEPETSSWKLRRGSGSKPISDDGEWLDPALP